MRVQPFNPHPNPFQGEGERREARMRKIFLSLILIAGGGAAFAQTPPQNPSQNSSTRKSALSLPVKKGFEKRKAELETMLSDYRAGKYTDVQGHAILVQMLFACGQLAEKESPDCRAAFKEYHNLNQKHPEFNNPPEFHKKYPALTGYDLLNIELPSQKAAREKEEKKKQEVQEQAKTWTPLDANAAMYHNWPYFVIIHSYRIEFYKLPSGVTCHLADGSPCHEHSMGNAAYVQEPPNSAPRFFNASFEKNGHSYSLKPFKIMKFGHPIVAPAEAPYEQNKHIETKIFAVGSSMDDYGYQGETNQEESVMKLLEGEGQDPSNWVQPNADYKEFYGVISIEGKILAQIPFHQHIPDKALKPVFAASDGRFAAFLVGHMAPPDDEDPHWGFSYEGVSGVILWTPKRGLRTVSLDEVKKEFPILEKWHIIP